MNKQTRILAGLAAVAILVCAPFVPVAGQTPARGQGAGAGTVAPAPAKPGDTSGASMGPAVTGIISRTPAIESDQFKIGPEDTLEISVWKNQDLSRTVVVRPDGKISLPLLNDLQAAGLTPLQLRDVLTKGYAAFQPEPEVAVIVREIHSIKVSVMGGVKNPGRYELKSQATVLEALALAGGFTDFAKRDQIVVLRRGARTAVSLPFNYGKVTSTNGEENFLLQSGDIIVVPN